MENLSSHIFDMAIAFLKNQLNVNVRKYFPLTPRRTRLTYGKRKEKERGNKHDQVSSESSILLGPEVLDLNYIIPIS